MTMIKSQGHENFIVDGERQIGFAETDLPIDIVEDFDLYTVKSGADGGMYPISTPRHGGIVTVTFFPTSPTCRYWIDRREEIRQSDLNGTAGGHRIFSATFSDPVQGISLSMEGGILLRAPSTVLAMRDYIIMLQFEKFIPDVAGATLTPPFENQVAA